MSVRRVFMTGLVTAVGGSLLAVAPVTAPAMADFQPAEAATALDLPAGVSVSALGGDPLSRAVADTGTDPAVAFNDFPSRGSSYVMLSSGDANRVFEGVPTSQLSTDFGDDEVPDASSLTVTVAQGTAGAGCLFVDFALGTEEALGKAEGTPGDELTIVNDGTDYAVNAGKGYFKQAKGDPPVESWPKETTQNYQVYDLDYWHRPGDPLDPLPGTAEDPRLAPVTGLNNLTTRDTARVPLDVASGAETVTITVRDGVGTNGDLDSVAFVDNVRLGSSCGNGSGVEPAPENQDPPNACCGIIRGVRGVGNALVYDPVPSTEAVERYDSAANGWRSPSSTPVELRFRWYRTSQTYRFNGDMSNWSAIPDADRQSYVPTAVDRGKVLIVLVTGVVDRRSYETFPATIDAATWYVTLPIDFGTFVEGEAPVIQGPAGVTAKVGDTLTAQIGNTVPRQDTYDWQWYAKSPGTTGVGSAVSGATGQSLVVGEALAGKVLTVRATARRDQFNDKSWDSVAYGPIQMQDWKTKTPPTIVHDGTPTNGEVLTVETGEWDPLPTSYSFQWRRNGAVISGATAGNYTLKDADAGAAITVDVSGVRTGYPQVPLTSPIAVTPAGKPMPGGTVTITGTPKVGMRLTGDTEWVPLTSSFTYAWYAGSTLLQKGTSKSYTVGSAAVGKPIILKVTAVKAGYEPLTQSSAPTAAVARGTLTTGTPRIYGTQRVGSTLRAYAGAWRPSPVTIAYRWKIGSRYVSGAAGRRSYLNVPKSARGKRITLYVIGSKAGYTTVKKYVRTSTIR